MHVHLEKAQISLCIPGSMIKVQLNLPERSHVFSNYLYLKTVFFRSHEMKMYVNLYFISIRITGPIVVYLKMEFWVV